MNNHYVPQLILRKYGGKHICFYDIKNKELKEHVKTEESFASHDIYPDEIEIKLNKKIEGVFANLLNNKILKCKSKISLKRSEIYLIKKFLLISTFRTSDTEKTIEEEKNYYNSLIEYWQSKGETQEDIESHLHLPPFKEKEIANETNRSYWIRTIDTFLNSKNCTQEEISKDKNATYAAYRWAGVVNTAFIGIWDSEFTRDEFLITDVGMTSENEVGWTPLLPNVKKNEFLIPLFQKYYKKDRNLASLIYVQMDNLTRFTENFMMFPLSAKRMIVLISPFFTLRKELENKGFKVKPLSYYSKLTNMELYQHNQVKYVHPPKPDTFEHIYDENDVYIYQIHKLTRYETRYCNELFLDRIDRYVGFSSLEKAQFSILKYYKDYIGHTPRRDVCMKDIPTC